MAKRRQTTGMPDKKRQERAQAEDALENASLLDNLLGNPTTRAEREEALNRLIIRGTIAIVVLLVLLIGSVLLYENVAVPNQSVATVNGESISVNEFRNRVNFERERILQLAINRQEQINQQATMFGMEPDQLLQQDQQYQAWVNELNFPDQLGQRVLDDMVDDLLVEQQAEDLGISVDDAAVESSINDFFGYDPTAVALLGADPTETPIPTETPTPFVSPTPTLIPTETPIPSPTPVDPEATAEATADVEATEEFTPIPSPTLSSDERQATHEANVEGFRDLMRTSAGVSDDVTDDFFRQQALRDAIAESLLPEDETVLYVNSRHILVETEEEAFEVLNALENGELFASLAQAVSTDTGSGSRGGELGWAPVENYVPEFEAAVTEAEIGEVTGPVESEFGYHIIQVRAREERDVEGDELEQIRIRRFNNWLETLREENTDNIDLADNWPDFVPQS